MIRTTIYSFWASIITALWLNADLGHAVLVSASIAPLVAAADAVSQRIAATKAQRRSLKDAIALFYNTCPRCDTLDQVEVTSDREITCKACRTRYHVNHSGQVVRRGKKAEQLQDGTGG